MKKTLAALLIMLLALTTLCSQALADTYRCPYLLVTDDADTAGDDTAEMEALYKDSVLVIDTDQQSIVISSDDTTITEDKITYSDQSDNILSMICESGNYYGVTTVDDVPVVVAQVGQTYIFFLLGSE